MTCEILKKVSLPADFQMTFELKDQKINKLLIKDLKIFEDGQLVCPYLFKSSLIPSKQELENTFSKEHSNSTKFNIENRNGKLLLKTQNEKTKTIHLIPKLSDSTAEKISDFYQIIENRKETNEIFSKAKLHNITELEKPTNTNKKLTACFLGLIALGFLAGIIGTGSLLTNLHIISPTMGIVGIPLSASITLASIGLLTILTICTLKIASAKSSSINEYLKDIVKMKGQIFLEGNSNDLTSGCLMLILGLSTLIFTGRDTVIGCLAFSTGVLVMMSATYQIAQSIKSLSNAKQTKDLEGQIKSAISLLFAINLLCLGGATTIGLANTLPHTLLMFGAGILSLTIAGFGMKKTFKNIKELYAVDATNPQSIIAYLQDTLSLKEEEIKQIKNHVLKMQKDELLKWIRNYEKILDMENKKQWEEIYQKLEQAQDADIEEIKKLIIKEEIKTAIEKKIDSFRGLVKKETYKTALNKLQDCIDSSEIVDEQGLTEIFKQIKFEVTLKAIVETVKFFLLCIPSMIVPAFKMKGIINVKLYDFICASLSFLSVSINATPRFRNVPPAIDKKQWSINDKQKTDQATSKIEEVYQKTLKVA